MNCFSSVLWLELNWKTHFIQTTCNLWKVRSWYVFKRLIRSDDDWFSVFISWIDNQEQIFFQPFCRILHSEIVNHQQFNFLHIFPKRWIFWFRILSFFESLFHAICYVCNRNEHHFCVIFRNQFIRYCWSSVCLSRSDGSSKIQSQSVWFRLLSFLDILFSNGEQCWNVFKVWKSFFFESLSNSRLFQKHIDFLHLIFTHWFDIFWTWFEFLLCLDSIFTRTEDWCDSISMNKDFFCSSNCSNFKTVFAITTRWRCLKISIHWLFTLKDCFEWRHSSDFNCFACWLNHFVLHW